MLHNLIFIFFLSERKNYTFEEGKMHDGVKFVVNHFVPQRLELLLATEVPEIERNAGNVDLANIQTHSGCNLARIHSFIVFREFRLRRFQISLRNRHYPRDSLA